ncbi:uncharacterized protein [Aristolochia californica]|uniref:uncharacterized protein n=1 Tax=Aristolochia californica TaxID=171875 RepID=UPI0035E0030F
MAVKIMVLASFLLLLSVQGSAVPEANRSRFEWQILTKKNFSSQIRLSPHILVMVTVPWSGESRSLMKALTDQAEHKNENFADLKLMVVYGNSERMLADLLGATEGTMFISYHHSVPYKYHGRLRALNILASMRYLMSLQHEELPLKSLSTHDDLKAFLKSTDKAILLLEFCGWTPGLINSGKEQIRDKNMHVWNATEDEGIFGENLNGESDKRIQLDEKKNQKGLKDEKLTCEAEIELNANSWTRAFMLENQTAPLEVGNRYANSGLSCSFEEFEKFQSFFTNFTTFIQDHFLPPERQRFGLVSDPALQSSLRVEALHSWILMVHVSGCPNCSRLLKEGDNLKNVIMMDQSLVRELEDERADLQATVPEHEPSIILFVDRSSVSAKLRQKSKSALATFRKLALHNQDAYQPMTGQRIANTKSSEQNLPGIKDSIISYTSWHPITEQTRVKFKDKMALLVVGGEGNVGLGNVAGGPRGNPAFDILAHLLQKKNPSFQFKEAKISDLAKQVGFQLLSDDFDVKIIDSPQPQKEIGQSKATLNTLLQSPGVQFSEMGSMDETGNKLLDMITNKQHLSEEPEVISESVPPQDAETARSDDGWKMASKEAKTDKEVEVDELTTDISSVDDKQHLSEEPGVISEAVPPQDAETVRRDDGWKIASKHAKIDKEVEGDEMTTDISSVDSEEHHGFQEKVVGLVTLNDEKLQVEHGQPSMEFLEASSGHRQSNVQPFQSQQEPNPPSACGSDAICFTGVSGKSNSVILESFEVVDPHSFRGSFFFSDGSYQLLKSLTSDSEVPSVVIIDPVLQQHYVFPKDTVLSYSALRFFIQKFLNGSLPSYQRSEPFVLPPRKAPRPPFTNLDFHEAESIPKITVRTFPELVLGSDQSNGLHSDIQNRSHAWKKDVLVLFSTSWCGFCQRMELVVREVYRFFKGYSYTLKARSNIQEPTLVQDKWEDIMLTELPSILLMDCTLNDCSKLLKSIGQRELYPALVLFPAEKKNAISYQGDMSVTDIIEFIAAYGSHSHRFSENKSVLWTKTEKGDTDTKLGTDLSSSSMNQQILVTKIVQQEDLNIEENLSEEDQSVELHASDSFRDKDRIVDVGSVLVATELIHTPPFNKSKILILRANEKEGFQGLIINKSIKWDFLQGIDEDLLALKKAPLSFGGPLLEYGMPLVSFTRIATEGYMEVLPNMYYGDPIATSQTIEGVRSGNRSAVNYWFFLGYSSWGWIQLFDELAEGAWQLSNYQVEQLEWPET